MLKITTAQEAQAFIDRYDTFLFDCDGVLWQGKHALEGIRETLDLLRSRGKRLFFVTNNSTKSRDEYAAKFKSLGLTATRDEIFSSAYASAYYIKNILKLPADKKVYAFGEGGLRTELEAEGIPVRGIDEDNDPINFDILHTIKPNPEIGAVVMGFDVELTYRKYARAFTYLYHNPECVFIATNEDATYPIGGTVYPGAGALISPIITALGREPIYMGKPQQTMLDCIMLKYHLEKEKTCMVGDRLNTDILFGINGGLSTLLVLTGVTSESEASTSEIRPDFLASSLGDLYHLTK
ncbi:2-phosphoglycolate phosphatase [Basidiobolus meristosporus CBS 931.73]|uniref:4-nitrophenylphosphatase n=1 Tax=Basidiobolus meristosporus CBS 931.73 TaxID=1314790 RepID=A0A1Y1Z4V9_9FUNG|nr:2-phosphoglycolate phosphatase [Basidiobolus meristosporus CBS 931.73]|eukprot:ORY05236.1 2-phosphoglycolate phosphatase [Basidiobolus meristosporus CBS 931.73]